ncbi:hypothetical protein [Thiolapillus sp.]
MGKDYDFFLVFSPVTVAIDFKNRGQACLRPRDRFWKGVLVAMAF